VDGCIRRGDDRAGYSFGVCVEEALRHAHKIAYADILPERRAINSTARSKLIAGISNQLIALFIWFALLRKYARLRLFAF
jgi:hypothetical protein